MMNRFAEEVLSALFWPRCERAGRRERISSMTGLAPLRPRANSFIPASSRRTRSQGDLSDRKQKPGSDNALRGISSRLQPAFAELDFTYD